MNRTMHTQRRATRNDGQALVLVVLALVAMLAMAGLVIDGGNLYAQQRKTQNWTDAAANAGAVQLLRRLIGVPGAPSDWDPRVVAAVNESIAVDGLESIVSTDYTNLSGDVLGPAGTGSIPDDAAGVRVVGQRSVGTYLAGIVGLSTFTATTDATAVAGYGTGIGQDSLLPLTFPVLFTQCDGNDLVVNGDNWPFRELNPVVIPMCFNSPGNVGWIDWTPQGAGYPPCQGAGTGTNELACSVENPNNPPMETPHWYAITRTGAISGSQVQSALEDYIGEDVNLPIFYTDASDPLSGTCNSTPANDQKDLVDCPIGDRGGTGANQWYYLVTLGSFHLQAVYVNGGSAACAPGTVSGTGNMSGCLIGYWNDDVVPADLTIGPGGGTPTPGLSRPTIQLIK